MRRIVHLLPRDDLGGAEKLVRDISHRLRLSFEVNIVYHRAYHRKEIVYDADYIFVSLWPSVLYYIKNYYYVRRSRMIYCVHSSHFKHIIDYIFFLLGVAFADQVVFDSFHSKFVLVQRFSWIKKIQDARIISAPTIERILHRKVTPSAKDYDLISVSRDDSMKNLPLVLRIFEKLMELDKDFKTVFIVANPTGETIAACQDLNNRFPKRFQYFVNLANSRVLTLLAQTKNFIQLSNYEGLSLTFFEAVSVGCVPVITNVGEPAELVPKDFLLDLSLLQNPSDLLDRVIIVIKSDTDFSRELLGQRIINRYESDWDLFAGDMIDG